MCLEDRFLFGVDGALTSLFLSQFSVSWEIGFLFLPVLGAFGISSSLSSGKLGATADIRAERLEVNLTSPLDGAVEWAAFGAAIVRSGKKLQRLLPVEAGMKLDFRGQYRQVRRDRMLAVIDVYQKSD
jgi:hypothetical protein